jgi:hypothetical protein
MVDAFDIDLDASRIAHRDGEAVGIPPRGAPGSRLR